MEIKHLTPDYAVSPQLAPADLAEARTKGFTTIVCNRPDEEVSADLHSHAMRAAAEAEGLRFVVNEVRNGALTEANVTEQRRALDEADGPVLAYCRSGTRSAVVWALGQTDRLTADEILRAAAEAGYALDGIRPQIEARGKG